LYSIHLKNIILYGKHGVNAEEKLIDAPFELNIDCNLFENTIIEKLEDTINYAAVFDIVKNTFCNSYDLLEVLAMDIAKNVKQKFNKIETVKISIYKLNPPIENMQGQVGITLIL
jgi:7,8-dihydroneopterin aldolase/epimerase/oxygenase